MENEQAVAEISPAPEPEATAAPESVETTPEEQQPTKSFSQEELDAIVSKRLAREQRKWEREQAQRLAEQQAKQPVAPPADPNDFESAQQYAEALAEQKAREMLAQREAKDNRPSSSRPIETVRKRQGINTRTSSRSRITPVSPLRTLWRRQFRLLILALR